MFIFAVCSSVAMVAQVRPPASLPAKRLFFLVIVCGLMARSTMLESSSIAAVGEEAFEDGTARDGIADRLGQF